MADANEIPPTGDVEARQQAASSLGKHISDRTRLGPRK